MTLHLLVEENMKPVPENIKIVDDYGDIDIVSNGMTINGNHMIISGSEEDLKNWLQPFDGVWVGDGQPFLQKFQIMHIK
jgi:hypothetical protein